MLNKLISLVFLLLFFNVNVVYSETDFLLPQKKPSIFKKTEKQIQKIISNNLPVPKPNFKKKEPIKPNKSEEKIENVKVKKTEEKKNHISKWSNFIYLS